MLVCVLVGSFTCVYINITTTNTPSQPPNKHQPNKHTHTAKYYPAVSLYHAGGRVRANFGPVWICDPREHGCSIPFRPVSALSKEPMKKEELAAYTAFVESRRAAWAARQAAARGGGGAVEGNGAAAAAAVGPE